MVGRRFLVILAITALVLCAVGSEPNNTEDIETLDPEQNQPGSGRDGKSNANHDQDQDMDKSKNNSHSHADPSDGSMTTNVVSSESSSWAIFSSPAPTTAGGIFSQSVFIPIDIGNNGYILSAGHIVIDTIAYVPLFFVNGFRYVFSSFSRSSSSSSGAPM
ncbi:hypothetical protein NEHOM01_1102 [Nematocida homosporus]|uniref:uncharacterized protein n=1 Tax=Nematocida homosporus TaxID=1912981 RepID=UPI00222046FA|nr:uncharacterized protein NEHOM01_1102 [Nematocida homosporus]KAI5185825.1 hypothetical protein NEHOM01_1102 [Nematocida homosporus]